jgi:hypothetical protein
MDITCVAGDRFRADLQSTCPGARTVRNCGGALLYDAGCGRSASPGARNRHPVLRPQLVRLGVLPASGPDDPLARRERARGFEPGFCPEPKR